MWKNKGLTTLKKILKTKEAITFFQENFFKKLYFYIKIEFDGLID